MKVQVLRFCQAKTWVFFSTQHSLPKHTKKTQKHLGFFSVSTSVYSVKAPFFKEVWKKKSKTNKGVQLFNTGPSKHKEYFRGRQNLDVRST